MEEHASLVVAEHEFPSWAGLATQVVDLVAVADGPVGVGGEDGRLRLVHLRVDRPPQFDTGV